MVVPATLEDQAHMPVEDPIEMGETWTNVEQKLKYHPDYPEDFRRAFGIDGNYDYKRSGH